MKKIFSIIFLILVCSISFAQQDMYSIGKRTQANPYVSKFEATFENMEYILSTPYVDTAYKMAKEILSNNISNPSTYLS